MDEDGQVTLKIDTLDKVENYNFQEQEVRLYQDNSSAEIKQKDGLHL